MARVEPIQCLGGKTVSGIEIAGRAVTVNQEEFGADDWHSWRAVLTLAYCRKLGGEGLNVEEIDGKEVKMALAGIVERWGEDSYFSQRAAKQLDVVLETLTK